MESYFSKITKKPRLKGIKYNLGNGRFTDSKKEFQHYLKKEIQFYQGLSEAYHSHSLKRKYNFSSKSPDLSTKFG